MSEIDEIRKRRNEAICKEWVAEQTRMMNGERPSVIMTQIGAKHGITTQAVAYVLRCAGLYNVK